MDVDGLGWHADYLFAFRTVVKPRAPITSRGTSFPPSAQGLPPPFSEPVAAEALPIRWIVDDEHVVALVHLPICGEFGSDFESAVASIRSSRGGASLTDGNTLVRLALTSIGSIGVMATGTTDPLARAAWGSVVEPRG